MFANLKCLSDLTNAVILTYSNGLERKPISQVTEQRSNENCIVQLFNISYRSESVRAIYRRGNWKIELSFQSTQLTPFWAANLVLINNCLQSGAHLTNSSSSSTSSFFLLPPALSLSSSPASFFLWAVRLSRAPRGTCNKFGTPPAAARTKCASGLNRHHDTARSASVAAAPPIDSAAAAGAPALDMACPCVAKLGPARVELLTPPLPPCPDHETQKIVATEQNIHGFRFMPGRLAGLLQGGRREGAHTARPGGAQRSHCLICQRSPRPPCSCFGTCPPQSQWNFTLCPQAEVGLTVGRGILQLTR